MADGKRIGAGLRNVAHGNIKASLSCKEGADSAATNGQLDHVLHLAHVDTVARHRLSVDAQAELGLIYLLFNAGIRRTTDVPDNFQGLVRQSAKFIEIWSADDDR